MKTVKEPVSSKEPVKRRKKLVIPEEPARMEVQEESATIEAQDQPAVTITIQSWATPVVGLMMLVLGLLGGYYLRPLILGQSSSTVPIVAPVAAISTTDNSAAQQDLMKTVVAQTRHFRGDPNAPVTIIEFGDFQCPFCGRHAATVGPQIDEQYIQSGKVRFGYFNFAFLGQESNWAAEAAECASDQNKFWEYHDMIYSSQTGENQGAFNKDNLKKFAEALGLDTSAFNECLDSGKYTQLIQEESSTASSMGVRSTPTFLINGQAIVGAQPFEIFQQTIDSFLK
ncbi:MAG: DsbA family protein [Anaerolineae bacterium]|nr:DsbA family protein [Anaerolineae bacterium]MCI0609881.1 DsbA family protein [Anaerolineae bacterium]